MLVDSGAQYTSTSGYEIRPSACFISYETRTKRGECSGNSSASSSGVMGSISSSFSRRSFGLLILTTSAAFFDVDFDSRNDRNSLCSDGSMSTVDVDMA